MRLREPYFALKGWLNTNDISQNRVAEIISTTANVVNKKLNGTGSDFSLAEARILHEKLEIPETYFFNLGVPLKGTNNKKQISI